MEAEPRHLINPDGSSFVGEIPELAATLAELSNAEREAYRDANSSAVARDHASQCLVVSGPGSGKSFLFLDRIRFWLSQEAAPEIHVSSFVRKLVKDLQAEIETKIEDERRANVAATTLHTLARSLIERNGGTENLRLGSNVSVMAQWTDLVWRDVLEFHPDLSRSEYPLRAFEGQLHDDELVETDAWSRLRATFDDLRSFYNAVGFADMIVMARLAVEQNPGLITQTHWIFDEFQDFNTAEQELVRAVTDRASAVLLAGDDDQALYQQLKRSHPEIIVAYYEDAAFANAMLPYCSRCSYYVCLAASAFIESHRDEAGIAKIYLPLVEDSETTKVQVVAAAAPTSAVDYVRGFIESHRTELEQHKAAMEAGEETDAYLLILTPERRVKFYKSGGADDELRELVAEWSNPAVDHSGDYWTVAAYHAADQNRSDNFAFRKVLELEGISVSAVHDLIAEALEDDSDLAAIDSNTVATALENCAAIAGVINSEELTPKEKAEQCAQLVSVSNVERLELELEADPISKVTDEGDEAIATGTGGSPAELLTIVGAKGLSAKHVVVLGCDDVNLGRTTPLAFYVALTRARQSLHLITAAKAGGAKAAHDFVLDLPEEHCDFVVHKKSGGPEELAGKAEFRNKLDTWAWVSGRGSRR